MNRLITMIALAAVATVALPIAFANTVSPIREVCTDVDLDGDLDCECPKTDADADSDQQVCEARNCTCPATKTLNISGQITLPPGHAAIPPPFGNPASATGSSRASANGNIVCHITGAPVAGTPPSCTRSYNAATGQWTTSGNCAAAGTATAGTPAWCSGGKASLPPGVRASLDASIQASLARQCDCAVVNTNSSCAGPCAPDAANPPTRNPVAGRDEVELSFSRQANGAVVVSILESWTIHCTGTCA